MKIGNEDITLKVGNTDVDAAYLGTTLVYSGGTPTHDYSLDYITFTATESGTFKFSGNSVNYSLDSGSTWANLSSNTNSPTVNQGDKILWKATGLSPNSTRGIGRFSSSAKFTVEGNAMSLVNGDNFIGTTTISDNQFRIMFSGCTGMTSAENLVLPATTLANYCYYRMFNGCTSLTTAPELPATALATYCYCGMFQGCASLTTVPELPATTLTNSCYQYMFYGCTGLTTAPELSATTLADSCYADMFNGCTSLTTAPVLPASTLVIGCCAHLFQGCTNLNYIKCLATDISASYCTNYWVNGVAANGTFVKAANMSSWPTGDSGIPNNWTVVDYTP